MILERHHALLTDLYQLTMMGGYHRHEQFRERRAAFELFFRRVPFGGGYCIAAGLADVVTYIRSLSFGADELGYLERLGLFGREFLDFLKTFRFAGDLWAVPEGTVVFAHEPLLRVEARLPEAQLVETALLNILNFQTLIATKAARICDAAGGAPVLEFGLRRAQGVDGSLSASRAACIGGCVGTSNVLAGMLYGLAPRGTQAHAWIMAFGDELAAFRAYADTYPDACLLLVDTYDTLRTGVPNAITAAKELEARGHCFLGIRLDSGDLAYLSREARRMLDEAGLEHAKIVASNDLDEYAIAELRKNGARVDMWGVGTNLVTARDCPALGGVYKLVAIAAEDGSWIPRIKLSSNGEKTTNPGVKQILRFTDSAGTLLGDVLADASEALPERGSPVLSSHLLDARERRSIAGWDRVEALLVPVFSGGELVGDQPELPAIRLRAQQQRDRLPSGTRRLTEPDPIWVGLSSAVLETKIALTRAAANRE
ncbi:MAG: nicotinate phosphoribosyltransferase [Candidatus Schekmanbacteria bacterium]|nr:nicotinate phosphoribosyltransferase [Candidatus Schekmanbacteria bacterium]